MQTDEIELLLEKEETVKNPSSRRMAKVSRKEIRLLGSSLARLLRGGIPLVRSLELIQKEFQSPSFRTVLSRIMENVKGGKGFSEALLEENFPSYFIAMVQSGEASGNLDRTLEMLSQHLEKEEEARRKIKEALAYPALVLTLGVATFLILLKFVIPKISLMYEGLGGELPFITRFVLRLEGLFFPILLVLTLGIGSLSFLFQRRQDLCHSVLLKLPLIGGIFQKGFLAHFTSVLALLLQSGIPILQALDSLAQTFSAGFFRKSLLSIRDALSEGRGLAKSLEHSGWIPETALALILSGEESGKLPEALQEIAKESQRELESQAHMLLKLLEPALILAVGVLVGFIVLSAILPILGMNELVK